MTLLAIACLLCATLPAAIFCLNLRFYRPPPPPGTSPLPSVSILIPARNEESGIAAAVQAALASTGLTREVIVMDDNSTDGTAETVRRLIAATNNEPRTTDNGQQTKPRPTPHPPLRLEQAPPLPAGWNGKQHACWALANLARHPILCFVDADVRLAPEAVARMAAFLASTRSSLVSGFPRQITATPLERLLLPLIHFVLLGFLPIPQMRSKQRPAYAAGCGQFLLVNRAAYFASGGHAAIRATMHDGIKLPRLLRAHGHRTDLADLTPLATCRMYTSAREVWNGLAKNATEGMAAPAAIVPDTLVLLLGQVLPFVLLLPAFFRTTAALFRTTASHFPTTASFVPTAASLAGHRLILSDLPLRDLLHHAIPAPWLTSLALVGCCAAWLPRLLAIRRFRQPVLGALLHPLGILALLAIQWYALARTLAGARVTWKSRAYLPS